MTNDENTENTETRAEGAIAGATSIGELARMAAEDNFNTANDQEGTNDTSNTDEEADDAEDNALGVNDTRKRDFFRRVRKLGTQAGDGAESLPKLALDVLAMSVEKVIDPKNAKGEIQQVYAIYSKKRDEKRQYKDANEGSVASQVSKLRVFEKLGRVEAFDPEDFMADVQNVYTDTLTKEKVKPVYAAYTDAARVALEHAKAKTTPTNDDIHDAIVKKEPKSKDLAKVMQGLYNTLDALITGTRKDGITTDAAEAIEAHKQLGTWLAHFTLEQELTQARETFARAGITLQ